VLFRKFALDCGLVTEGEKFARAMLNDTVIHRQKTGQRIISSDVLSLSGETERKLRAWIKAQKEEIPETQATLAERRCRQIRHWHHLTNMFVVGFMLPIS
jgi:hypothetical protein